MSIKYRYIDEYPGYRIGDNGSVWSRHNNRWGLHNVWRELKPGILKSKDAKNYARKAVYLGRNRFRYVHHLVLEAFVGKRPKGYEACHKNGDPLDNNVDNLYWGSPSENDADQRRHGRKKGELHHAATLNNELVLEIRRRVSQGETHQSIANSLGIKRRNVGRVADRTRWKHV